MPSPQVGRENEAISLQKGVLREVIVRKLVEGMFDRRPEQSLCCCLRPLLVFMYLQENFFANLSNVFPYSCNNELLITEHRRRHRRSHLWRSSHKDDITISINNPSLGFHNV